MARACGEPRSGVASPGGRLTAAVLGAAALLVVESCGRREVVDSFPTEYAGVGLDLRIDGDQPVVRGVLAGGAAEAAGVLDGDRLTAIDGRSTAGKSLGDVVMALRGPPESQVMVTVRRGSQTIIFVVQRQAMSKQGGDYRAAERAGN